MSTNITNAALMNMNEPKQFETIDNGLLVRAPAKINLSLLIAGKRPDGFHEIETVMAKVNFFDEILIQQGRTSGVELLCKGPYQAPEGQENLIYQACQMLLDSCRLKTNIKITLTKNIPAGSGLGSASSDAAATLLGVEKFLQSRFAKIPKSETPKTLLIPQKLSQMAAKLGTDVPFFLGGPLAFCTGKGEKIKKLVKNFRFLALLLLPNVSVPTKKVYNNYKHNKALYETLNTKINRYIQKNRFDLVSKMCANMLQTTCFGLYKGLAELKTKVESLGIRPLCLSGSGSAMFCIVDNTDEQTARQYQRKLEEKVGCKSVIVTNNRW